MKTSLTGKTRYRVRGASIFSDEMIILQVEELVTDREYTSNGGGRVEIEPLPDLTRWRDATFVDLQELGEI